MQETELDTFVKKAKNMHIIDDELYFVIDERIIASTYRKRTRRSCTGNVDGKNYLYLLTLYWISKFKNDPNLSEQDKIQMKDKLVFRVSSEASEESTHWISFLKLTLCLIKIWVCNNRRWKIAIVDEFTGRVLPGQRSAMVFIKQ